MQFLENELNEFETYTYNIKLYMVSENNIKNLEHNIQTGNAKLVAGNVEMSQFNITSVEQLLVIGHDKIRSAFGNRFQIEITEPNGVTFLNTLAITARSLNIENHQKAYYLLQIEFIGRTHTNAPKKFGTVFNYIVRIGTFEMSTSENGTIYSIDAVENTADGYSYLSGVIKGQITVNAATVGEFIYEFSRKLEHDLANLLDLDEGRLFQDIYNFEFADDTKEWANWKMQALNDPIFNIGYDIIGQEPNRKLQIVIPNGSSIPDIFGMVLGLTAEYKQIVKHSGGYFKNNSSDRDTGNMDNFPVFYKILTNATTGKFDPLRGDYQKNITFTLKKYIMPEVILGAVPYKNSITNTKIQTSRINEMNKLGLLRKKYDYLFSGNNTEILDLDLKFNFGYYSTTPYGIGFYGDSKPQLTKDGSTANMMDALQVAKKNYSIAVRDLNTANNVKNDKLKLADRLKSSTRNPHVGFDSTIVDFTDITNIIKRNFAAVDRAATALADAINTYNDFNPVGIAHQVHFEADVINQADAYGSENDNSGGSFQFGIIKGNVESQVDMATIELHVRGDPYWLGLPLSYDIVNTGGAGTVANYTSGSIFFYLKTHFATPDVNSNGLRIPSDDYQLSGLYKVTTVINNYKDGQFTQYLTANLDTGTNIPTISHILDSTKSLNEYSGARLTIREIDKADALEEARDDLARRNTKNIN